MSRATPTGASPFSGTSEGRVVLVTGGAGFIGCNLVDRLARSGHRVRVYDNLSRPGVRNNLRWLLHEHRDWLEVIRASVTERGPLRRAVRGVGAVFHLAARAAVTASLEAPLADFETNARGTLELLEALRARAKPPPLIFTSSNQVYGCLADTDLEEQHKRWLPVDSSLARSGMDEQRPLDLRSPYGCSKGAADQYVLDYARTFGLPAAVLRPSCVYGPHQLGNEEGWIAHYLLRAIRGEAIDVDGDGKQVRDILFVDDLVEALLLTWDAIDLLAGGAFNVGGGPTRTLSRLELLDLIGELRGGRPPVVFSSARPGYQRYYVSDCRRLERATGWSAAISVRGGIERLHEQLLDRWSAGTRGEGAFSAAGKIP